MNIHRNTTVSVILSIVSLGLNIFHFFAHPSLDVRLIASIASVIAYGAVMSEFKKYSSMFQILGIFLSIFTLGISIDHAPPFIPFITIALLLSGVSFKKYFRKWFSETDMIWLDMASVIASTACYLYGNLNYTYGWNGWLLPVMPLAANYFFSISDFMYGYGSLKYITGKKQNIETGKIAPEFSLNDKAGNVVQLADYKDKQHVLLIFIRNDWCPSCRIKLRTYERHRDKFNEKNVQLLTISPSGKDADKEMSENLGINFNLS